MLQDGPATRKRFQELVEQLQQEHELVWAKLDELEGRQKISDEAQPLRAEPSKLNGAGNGHVHCSPDDLNTSAEVPADEVHEIEAQDLEQVDIPAELPGSINPPDQDAEILDMPAMAPQQSELSIDGAAFSVAKVKSKKKSVRLTIGNVEMVSELPQERTSSIKRLSLQMSEHGNENLRFSDLNVDVSRLENHVQLEQDTAFACKVMFSLQETHNDPARMLQLCLRCWSDYTSQMRATIEFKMHDRWAETDSELTVHNKYRSSALSFQEKAEADCGMAARRKLTRHQRMIMSPNSPKRAVWELLGTILLFYDLIVIPLGSFHLPDDAYMKAMEWMTLVFWTMDVVATCFTGYVHAGETVMAPKLILKRYLITWFILDFIIVVPDWLFLIIELSQGSGQDKLQGVGVLRGLRIVRSARILRLVKVARFLERVKDAINSEGALVVLNVSKLLLGLLGISHLLASLWYLVGDYSLREGYTNWIDGHHLSEKSLTYRYLTSMHWSMTQFTPASMDVQPTNSLERLFALCLLLLGLVIFSSFISSITQNMMQLASIQDVKDKQMWILRKYLKQHHVKRDLFYRVLRYLDYHFQKTLIHIPESKVTVLSMLSKPLRSELRYVVSFSCLQAHPLFEKIDLLTDVMRRLVYDGLAEYYLAIGDVGLECSSEAKEMFCLETGLLSYTWAVRGSLSDEMQTNVNPGDWLCEACMWTTWVHMGSARARLESKMVSIDANKFANLVKQHSIALKMARCYAVMYLSRLSSQSRKHLSDIMRGPQSTKQFGAFYETLGEELEMDLQDAAGLADLTKFNIGSLVGSGSVLRVATTAFLPFRKSESSGPATAIVPVSEARSPEDSDEESDDDKDSKKETPAA